MHLIHENDDFPKTQTNSLRARSKEEFTHKVFFTYAHVEPRLLTELLNYSSQMYDACECMEELELRVKAKAQLCSWLSPLVNSQTKLAS